MTIRSNQTGYRVKMTVPAFHRLLTAALLPARPATKGRDPARAARFQVRAPLENALQIPRAKADRYPGCRRQIIARERVGADFAAAHGVRRRLAAARRAVCVTRHAGPAWGVVACHPPPLVWSMPIGAGPIRTRTALMPPPSSPVALAFASGFAVAGDCRLAVRAPDGVAARDLTAAFDSNGGVSISGLAADGGRLFATTGYGETVATNAADGSVIWRVSTPEGDTRRKTRPRWRGNLVFAVADDGTGLGAQPPPSGRIAWNSDQRRDRPGCLPL